MSNDACESDVVDWDGPNDPENPKNWSSTRKITATITIALISILTPLGSSMVAPSTSQLMDEFHFTSDILGAFVVSVYLLGYAIGPLILAPLSELYGRMPIYHVCNILYLVWTVACALAPNLSAMIVFRLIAGMAGSAPLTIGAGSLADMIPAEKRGLAMGAWMLGPVLGPVIGPIAGAYLAESAGWRWTFWVLAIGAGVFTILTALFLRESYAYAILQRKTMRLRKETGNNDLRSILDTGRSRRNTFAFSILRPTKMLLLSPIVALLSIYIATIYGYLYLLFTTLTPIFHDTYNFSSGNVGLSYLGIGVGSVAGLIFQVSYSDRLYLRLVTKDPNTEPKPEYRLPPLCFTCWLMPASLLWYGWTAEREVHWIAPIIGTSLVGFGMLNAFTVASTYLVDAYTVHAASAVAAVTVLRSLGGAFLPLAGGPMYDALGLGWGNTLLAGIALAMCPLPFVFYRYGERIRKGTNVQF
ncbi:cycloheximide resistance protein [Aspergillus ustus]|uniref:Cycloheximide resistance protein n=1 Tax=Aspergillus ustus TaxID=40382 RepID=A0A0C1C3K5_ASPUT|nr:cycloheximide resistance protein [Aspergillus ustus]